MFRLLVKAYDQNLQLAIGKWKIRDFKDKIHFFVYGN